MSLSVNWTSRFRTCSPHDFFFLNTLSRRIVGEDQTLLIKFGKDAGESATEETVLVRGLRSEVERAVAEINKIVTDAKEDEILSSYVSSLRPLPFVEVSHLCDSLSSSKSGRNSSVVSSVPRVRGLINLRRL